MGGHRSGLQLLAQMSGLSEEEVRALARGVVTNRDALANCVGPHQFVETGAGPRARWVCALCSGWVAHSEAHWYRLGQEHTLRALASPDTGVKPG